MAGGDLRAVDCDQARGDGSLIGAEGVGDSEDVLGKGAQNPRLGAGNINLC